MGLLKSNRRIAIGILAYLFFGLHQQLAAAATHVAAPMVDGTFFETQIDPKANSNFMLALFRVWLPSRTPVDGVLTVLPGSDCHGIPMADDPAWQAIAARWNYALLGVTFTTRSGAEPYYRAEKGSGNALVSALEQLSVESGHPELAKAPVAILGHSQGGQFAYHFACWKPERTVAFAAIKGGYYDVEPNDAAKAVPGLLIAGALDFEYRRTNIRRLFELNESPPGKWCYALEPEAAHKVGRSLDLIVPFFHAVIKEPSDPRLGDPDSLVVKKPDANTNAHGAWFPTSAVADTWLKFMKGELSGAATPLDIPYPAPPELARLSHGSYDFGKIKADDEVAPVEFRIRHPAEGPQWDTVRATSLHGRLDVSVTNTDDGCAVSVRPKLTTNDPLGRLHDTLFFRFSRNGKDVLGGSESNVTFYHANSALRIAPDYFYVGVHSAPIRRTIRLTATTGEIHVHQTKLVSGTAASLRILQEAPNSVVLDATFESLPESGTHSGVFSVDLDEPIKAQFRVPFIGHFAPKH